MEKYKSAEDIELVELVRNGNQLAFKEIVTRNKQLIARTVKSMLGDTAEADDVGQEVFIRFYKAIGFYKGDSKLSTYLTRIAINLSLNEIKKRKNSKTDLKENINELDFGKNRQFDQTVNNIDLKDALKKALESLDSPFRTVVSLRLVDGYSTKETADILDLPMGTVLSRLARAQKKMQKELTNYLK